MVLVTKIYAFALQNDMFCYKRNRFDAIISLPQYTIMAVMEKDGLPASAGGMLCSRRYRNRRLGEFLKELGLTEGRATVLWSLLGSLCSCSPLVSLPGVYQIAVEE